MIKTLKIIASPILFILPWILIRISGLEKTILGYVLDNPIVFLVIFFPSVLLLIVWVSNYLYRKVL